MNQILFVYLISLNLVNLSEVLSSDSDKIITQESSCYYIKKYERKQIMAHVNPFEEEYFISLNDEAISEINIDGCDFKDKPVHLSLTYNKLKTLKISNQKSLVSLRLNNNEDLVEVQLANLPNLKYLYLHESLKILSLENIQNLVNF